MSLSLQERAELQARGMSASDIQAVEGRLKSVRYRIDAGNGITTVAASIAASLIGRRTVLDNAIAGRVPATITL